MMVGRHRWKMCNRIGRWLRVKATMAPVIFLLALFSSGLGFAKMSTPQENLDQMLNLQEEHGDVITIDDVLFNKYIKSKHSKYSVVAMFTALDPKYACEICPEARDEFFVLASSYAAMQSSKNLFFVLIDYNDAPKAFKTMGLDHAPEFLYFPGTRKRIKKSDRLDTMRIGYDGITVSKWLLEVDGTKIAVKRPIDFKKLIGPSVAALILAVIVALNPNLVMHVFESTTLWGGACLVLVLAMTSGQMWNAIQKPMDAGRDMRGDMELIMTGDHGQFRYESYLVIALNAVISFGFILLNHAKEIKHWLVKKVIGVVGLCMIVIFFGLLISIFRMKNYGYPYLFLFT